MIFIYQIKRSLHCCMAVPNYVADTLSFGSQILPDKRQFVEIFECIEFKRKIKMINNNT